MFKLLIVLIISCFVCCCGKPVADSAIANHNNLILQKRAILTHLQHLMDEAVVEKLWASIRRQELNYPTNKEATAISAQKQTISNSKPKSRSKPLLDTVPSFGDRTQEVAITPNKSPLQYNASGSISSGQKINSLDKKPVQQMDKKWPTNYFSIIFEDKFQEIIASTTTKRPVNGQPSQLADNLIPTFEDRFQEVLPLPSSSKSPLEYNGQRPSFAGQFSNGQSSQLIPSGNPLPAGNPSFVPVKDRFEEDNIESVSTTTKSPLEYNGQRPSFAGQFSNGQPSQLIPSGNPLPAGNPSFVPVKDRFEEDNEQPQIALSTTTKSPLEYHGQRPSFAGQFSNGQPSQLIPSGSLLPAGPLNFVPVKDRFKDDNEQPQIDFSTTTKSPLEYHGQKPSFAGQFSNGQLSQLIPSGSPLPAGPLNFVPVKDRLDDDTEQPQIALATTKSPLEYHGQKPSFASQFSNGQPSQLIPSGSPLPAGPFNFIPVKDRLEDDNEEPQRVQSTTTKSPLEYHSQRPSFAGQFSNGQPSQLIAPGSPLPAGPSNFVPVKDRLDDDTEQPQIALATTKSPLEYHGQKPSFAGQFSNGQPSQLIPSGSPLPAGPSNFVPVKDRLDDDTEQPQIVLATTTKSPLEYHGQKPSFAGQFSNGQPSQLIPSGSPLPAGPSNFVPVKDRLDDDTEQPQIALATTKSPLEYHGQKPSFAGQFSNGQPSQLIPSGSLLPAGPSNFVPVKDRLDDDSEQPQIALATTKSPLEYHDQRPSFASQFSNGQPSQLIPSGNPLPAGPLNFVPIKDRFEDDNEDPQTALPTATKSPLEYHGQKPSFAGQFSNGQLSQLIPSANPLPSGPSSFVPVKDRFKKDNIEAVPTTTKSPLEYNGQKYSFSGPLDSDSVDGQFKEDGKPAIVASKGNKLPLEYNLIKPVPAILKMS